MSKWPRHIAEYVSKNVKRNFILTQSKHSKHKIMATRLEDTDVLISYNPDAEYFVAWSAPINTIQNIDDRDDVHFVLRNRSHIAAGTKFSSVYENTGSYTDIKSGKVFSRVYKKICVFSVENFIEFYENFEKYILPNSKDAGYKTPVFNSNGKEIIG